MSTHVSKSMNITDIAVRAVSYNIKGITLDGNDVITIYKETLKARDYVLQHGPMLMVLNTYRWMGHSKSDAQLYRTKEEVDEWKNRDPIKQLRETLLEERHIPVNKIEEIDKEAEKDVEEALAFAEQSPEPRLDSILADVYAD